MIYREMTEITLIFYARFTREFKRVNILPLLFYVIFSALEHIMELFFWLRSISVLGFTPSQKAIKTRHQQVTRTPFLE